MSDREFGSVLCWWEEHGEDARWPRFHVIRLVDMWAMSQEHVAG